MIGKHAFDARGNCAAVRVDEERRITTDLGQSSTASRYDGCAADHCLQRRQPKALVRRRNDHGAGTPHERTDDRWFEPAEYHHSAQAGEGHVPPRIRGTTENERQVIEAAAQFSPRVSESAEILALSGPPACITNGAQTPSAASSSSVAATDSK